MCGNGPTGQAEMVELLEQNVNGTRLVLESVVKDVKSCHSSNPHLTHHRSNHQYVYLWIIILISLFVILLVVIYN